MQDLTPKLRRHAGQLLAIAPVLFQGQEPTNNGIDLGRSKDDPGRMGVTNQRSDGGKFKAPSLRNIELTGPYMHDGRFDTLSRVVRHYSDGIREHDNLDPLLQVGAVRSGSGWGARPPVLTQPRTQSPVTPQRFDFTREERTALVVFLKTLTDDQFIKDRRFSDPFR